MSAKLGGELKGEARCWCDGVVSQYSEFERVVSLSVECPVIS